MLIRNFSGESGEIEKVQSPYLEISDKLPDEIYHLPDGTFSYENLKSCLILYDFLLVHDKAKYYAFNLIKIYHKLDDFCFSLIKKHLICDIIDF